MKIHLPGRWMTVIATTLLVGALSGCSSPPTETNTSANRGNAPAATNLTPQQQEATQAAQQHEGDMRAAMARQQQQSQHH